MDSIAYNLTNRLISNYCSYKEAALYNIANADNRFDREHAVVEFIKLHDNRYNCVCSEEFWFYVEQLLETGALNLDDSDGGDGDLRKSVNTYGLFDNVEVNGYEEYEEEIAFYELEEEFREEPERDEDVELPAEIEL